MYLNEIPVGAEVILVATTTNRQSVEIKTIVKKVSQERLQNGICAICIDAIKRGKSFIDLNSAKITLRYFSEEFDREFIFKINNTTLNKPANVHILYATQEAQPTNRRENVRITLIEKATFRLNGKGTVYKGYTVDISKNGILLSTEDIDLEINVNDYLTCSFYYTVTGTQYDLNCIVRHVELINEGRKPILKIGCEIKDTKSNMTALISNVQRNELRKLKKY